jgi:hypothetical protein
MWIVWAVPFMVLGVAIAVVPVLWGSIHFHRVEHLDHQLAMARASAPAEATPSSLAVDCPTCATRVRGITQDHLIDEVHRHAWRVHGIPSDRQIMESAVPA